MRSPTSRWKTAAQWQRNLYILFVAEFLSVTGFLIVAPFLSLYVEKLGATFGSVEFWAGMAFSVMALARVGAGAVWGALADRFGRKLKLQRAIFGGALLLGLMGVAPSALSTWAVWAIALDMNGCCYSAH